MTEMTHVCRAHLFVRFRPWPIRDRWRCVLCRRVTRHYDSIDRQAMRPVHDHMSVAYKGVNTLDNGHAIAPPKSPGNDSRDTP